MSAANDNIIDLIARGATVKEIADYELSPVSKAFFTEMINKKMTVGLTPDEDADLAEYLELEQLMLAAKERARALYSSQL